MHRLFDPVIARSARLGAGLDWKTSLQELTAAGFLGVPEYHVEESGPDHQKFFRASVWVGGRSYGSGQGHSKKEAEQQAAEAAWTAISNGHAAATQDGRRGRVRPSRPGRRTQAQPRAAGRGPAPRGAKPQWPRFARRRSVRGPGLTPARPRTVAGRLPGIERRPANS